MFNKIIIIISAICLNTFISGCCKTVYKIDQDNLTNEYDSKHYLDVMEISKINKGRKTFILTGDKQVYIKNSDELMLKRGWKLIGNSGNEVMIKEKSLTTSAIKIKGADDIKIKNFHLKTDEYVVALEKSLIEIDNEKKVDGKIEIVNMTLSNHYSAVWIKRGRNILLDSCLIFGNGHQIYLGFLPKDTSETYKYEVNAVTISNSEIRDSRADGNIDGIKTLSNCMGIRILNNLIANNKQDGIDLYPGGLEVLIRNNTIRDNGIHGVEVKMIGEYPLGQTGQIREVQIDSNIIINNKYNGITCLDSGGIYYAEGITVTNNKIDSNEIYGIYSELPIRIQNNILWKNGLNRNTNSPDRPIGFPGIYLLKGRPNNPSFVLNNEIIDQAPIDSIILAYWMVVTEAKSKTTIKDNNLVISDGTINNPIKKYGIGLINSSGYTDGEFVKMYNKFSDYFNIKVVIQ